MRLALSLLLLLWSGCARYRDDVEAICRAAPPERTPLALDHALASVRMRTEKGRALLARLQASDVDPAAALTDEAARAAISPCPLAEAFVAARAQAGWEHDVRMLCGFALAEIADRDFQSDRGRALRDRLAPLSADERKGALREEARRLSLAGCAKGQ